MNEQELILYELLRLSFKQEDANLEICDAIFARMDKEEDVINNVYYSEYDEGEIIGNYGYDLLSEIVVQQKLIQLQWLLPKLNKDTILFNQCAILFRTSDLEIFKILFSTMDENAINCINNKGQSILHNCNNIKLFNFVADKINPKLFDIKDEDKNTALLRLLRCYTKLSEELIISFIKRMSQEALKNSVSYTNTSILSIVSNRKLKKAYSLLIERLSPEFIANYENRDEIHVDLAIQKGLGYIYGEIKHIFKPEALKEKIIFALNNNTTMTDIYIKLLEQDKKNKTLK